MLPPEAAEYFRRLCSKRFADLASDFSRELREFERDQAARGQFGGSGYVARMAGLYEKRLKAEAKAIVAIQREVHVGFGSPLDAGVGEQLQAWGLDVLDNRYEAMQGSFVRELGRFSIPAPDLDFAHTRALAHVTVANMIADDLWTMRNVPMSGKKPEPGTTINNNTFSGPVGVVQGRVVVHAQVLGGKDNPTRVQVTARRRGVAKARGTGRQPAQQDQQHR